MEDDGTLAGGITTAENAASHAGEAFKTGCSTTTSADLPLPVLPVLLTVAGKGNKALRSWAPGV